MEIRDYIAIAALVVAFIVVAYLYWKHKGEFKPSDIAEIYQDTEFLAEELEKVGLMAVAAVEQLKSTGKIDTNEEAFNQAFDYIATWPGMDRLDRKTIARAVEGSYRLYQNLTKVKKDGQAP